MATSQRIEILRHLSKGLTLTPREAMSQFGCYRLAARVAEIRASGHDVRTEIIKAGSARVARYRLQTKKRLREGAVN